MIGYRAVLDLVIAMFRADAAKAAALLPKELPTGDSPEEKRARRTYEDAYLEAMTTAVYRARKAAWAAAALHLDDQAIKQASARGWVPPQPGYSPEAVEITIRETPGKITDPTSRIIIERSLTRHVETAARETIRSATGTGSDELTDSEREAMAREAAERLADAEDLLESEGLLTEDTTDGELRDLNPDEIVTKVRRPFAYARMIHPERGSGKPACGFCVMLVGRGPVYATKRDAEGTPGDPYHNHCRCTAEPVYSSLDWPGKDQYEEYEKAYQMVVVDENLTGAAARTAMDQWARGNRSDEKSAARTARKADADTTVD